MFEKFVEKIKKNFHDIFVQPYVYEKDMNLDKKFKRILKRNTWSEAEMCEWVDSLPEHIQLKLASFYKKSQRSENPRSAYKIAVLFRRKYGHDIDKKYRLNQHMVAYNPPMLPLRNRMRNAPPVQPESAYRKIMDFWHSWRAAGARVNYEYFANNGGFDKLSKYLDKELNK